MQLVVKTLVLTNVSFEDRIGIEGGIERNEGETDRHGGETKILIFLNFTYDIPLLLLPLLLYSTTPKYS